MDESSVSVISLLIFLFLVVVLATIIGTVGIGRISSDVIEILSLIFGNLFEYAGIVFNKIFGVE